MIDRKNFFDQPVRNDLMIYDSIWNIATSQGDDYTIGSLLDYFKKYCKMIAIDLRKTDADPKAMQYISFTGNLQNSAVIYFIFKEEKKVLDFLQGTVKVS